MCADSGRICADNSALSKRAVSGGIKRAVSGVTETAAEYVQTTFRKCTELSAMFKRAANCGLVQQGCHWHYLCDITRRSTGLNIEYLTSSSLRILIDSLRTQGVHTRTSPPF